MARRRLSPLPLASSPRPASHLPIHRHAPPPLGLGDVPRAAAPPPPDLPPPPHPSPLPPRPPPASPKLRRISYLPDLPPSSAPRRTSDSSAQRLSTCAPNPARVSLAAALVAPPASRSPSTAGADVPSSAQAPSTVAPVAVRAHLCAVLGHQHRLASNNDSGDLHHPPPRSLSDEASPGSTPTPPTTIAYPRRRPWEVIRFLLEFGYFEFPHKR